MRYGISIVRRNQASTPFITLYTKTTGYITSASNEIMIKADRFGDATAADVMKGKTFTSKNGLKITGTYGKPSNPMVNTSEITTPSTAAGDDSYLIYVINAGTVVTTSGSVYYVKNINAIVSMRDTWNAMSVSMVNLDDGLIINTQTGNTVSGASTPSISSVDISQGESAVAKGGPCAISAIPLVHLNGERPSKYLISISNFDTTAFKVKGSMLQLKLSNVE